LKSPRAEPSYNLRCHQDLGDLIAEIKAADRADASLHVGVAVSPNTVGLPTN